jgi:uncharacterized low-complexity protein
MISNARRAILARPGIPLDQSANRGEMTMTKTSIKKTSALLSAALVASLGLSHAANANTGSSLFSATDLGHGYMANVGEGKCGEGKCGEGKCGGDSDDEKGGEGKCGEGKCGSV